MQRDILHDAVALIEDAEHRDALRHRRHTGVISDGRRGIVGLHRAGLRLLSTPARGEAKRKQ